METKYLNFEHGFRPAYYFSRFVGLWPFSIVHHSNGTIQRAWVGFFDGLWFIISICLKLALAFRACERLKTVREKPANRIRFIEDNTYDMSCFLVGVIATVLDMINRNKLVDILRKFNAFDNEVRFFFLNSFSNSNEINNWNFNLKKKQVSQVGIQFNYGRDYRRSWIYFMTAIFIILILINFEVSTFENVTFRELINASSIFCICVVWTSVKISFIIFIRSLRERFIALNFLLRFPILFKFISSDFNEVS